MPQDALSQIEVTAKHSPLAFIYDFFTPTIVINGQTHKRPWGTSSFDLAPGNYSVSVSYPWLLAPECGKNTITFTLQAGETKRVSYRAGLIRYLPGRISVN
jgi:hypothetical protein